MNLFSDIFDAIEKAFKAGLSNKNINHRLEKSNSDIRDAE